jgi:hypothetical protein
VAGLPNNSATKHVGAQLITFANGRNAVQAQPHRTDELNRTKEAIFMNTNTLPQVLSFTLHEAAEYLKREDQTLRIWRHRNIGPKSYRVGNRVYYDKEDIDAWIAVEKLKTARGGI